MHAGRLVLGILAVLPALLMTGVFLAGDLVALLDPCHRFADDPPLAPGGACRGVTTLSQARGDHLLTTLVVKGALLLACGLAVVGMARGSAAMTLAGAAALLGIGLPLMTSFAGPVAFLSAAFVLAATRALPALPREALWASRILSVVVALLVGAQAVYALRSGNRAYAAFSSLLLVVPAIMLWAAWWPRRPARASPSRAAA